jgi:hypothetical protein
MGLGQAVWPLVTAGICFRSVEMREKGIGIHLSGDFRSQAVTMKARRLFFLLTLVLVPAVSPSAESATLRLRDVKTVYVGSFGNGPGADLIRAKVITDLVKSGRLEVAESPENADAILHWSRRNLERVCRRQNQRSRQYRRAFNQPSRSQNPVG